jgi:hypothetical protein
MLRTASVATVLDAVRETGMSAHPRLGEPVSALVAAVAADLNVNPVDLQDAVERWADALDAAADVDAIDAIDAPADWDAGNVTFDPYI